MLSLSLANRLIGPTGLNFGTNPAFNTERNLGLCGYCTYFIVQYPLFHLVCKGAKSE